MKKVLLIVIAAAVGVGIYMLMQSNKMPSNGQSSEIAPITNDTMTPAETDNSKTESAPAMDTTAPADDNSSIPPCPSTPDSTTPGTMMKDGQQVPCMPSTDNVDPAHHTMTDTQGTTESNQQSAPVNDMGNNTPESIQSKEDAMTNPATTPGAPIDNVNETTK